jgi:hypothetical protein
MSVEYPKSDQRRVRFASIEGLAGEDLPLAREIWLDDLFHSLWVSREAMKLAAHFVRYMADLEPSHLNMREIERELQLVRDDIQRALILLRTFGAIDAFSLDKDDLKVALNLTLLQRLRVFESGRKLIELVQARSNPSDLLPVRETRWAPEPAPVASEDAAGKSPLLALIAEEIRHAARR